MARLARVEVFAPDEVAIVHVMNRTVRRCFLMGNENPLRGQASLMVGSTEIDALPPITYDTSGRKKTEGLTISSQTYTTTIGYNFRSELTQLTYPDGATVNRD